MGNTNKSTINIKPTKIIFLDIDGVLNNAKSDISELFIIEKELLRILKKVIIVTNAVLVLSSTWRYTEETRTKVINFLKSEHIPSFISCTPNLGINRTDEIICWLQDNTDFNEGQLQDAVIETRTSTGEADLPHSLYTLKYQMHVTHWIAIDDMDLTEEGNVVHIVNRFIHVNKKVGLTEKDADLAIALLNA